MTPETSSAGEVPERLVVDASALVDVLVGAGPAPAVVEALRGAELHAPAHLDAELLSALGRLERAGRLSVSQVSTRIKRVETAPIERHHLTPLLAGAWSRRRNLRLVDALYVELASQLGARVVSTDAALARASTMVTLID